MVADLIDTWRIHQRIHLYLLGAVSPGALEDVSASKGRTVAEQFAHIHNVRLMWLQSAAPDLAASVSKLEKAARLDHTTLRTALEGSAAAIEQLLARAFEPGGKIKGFKPHPAAFLGYLISHESHHRGQVALTLKQAGHPLDKKTSFGLWEWGVR